MSESAGQRVGEPASRRVGEWGELEARYTSGVYVKRPLVVVRGEGARVWDAQGRAYIDCVGGHGVANVGHCHPQVVAAIQEQAERLITCPESFYNDRRAELQAELVRMAPPGLERVFLCNSGAEAVEAAIKFARLATGRPGIVAAKNGFHGRTLGALSATWRSEYRQPFEPLLPGFVHVPYNDAGALDEAIGEDTAAVILEVVQGEGGVIVGDGDTLRRAQTLCHERGALFIVDEVQTGFGRTGRLFACQHHGLEPDLLCLAKAIAGGIPMGAVLIGPRVGRLPGKGHGSTFGGNPLACAAALAAMRVIEEEALPQRAAELGAFFLSRLRQVASPLIREVRGLGLMVGIELKRKVQPYLEALMERGVLALAAGPIVMRFLPPLVISREELETVVRAVQEVLST
ncbi:MAG: acetylornithine/succinylornithine family transaminase [Anaerolineae bacterium]|nr:acetylornithine/succinylornithine family transaminase [Anaerolineae bacterium]